MRQTQTLLVTLLGALALPAIAAAAPPAILPIQGYMTNSSDLPLDGTYSVKFELFDASTAGTSLYSTTIANLPFSDGYFTVYLGDTGQTALDLTTFRDEDIVWLEISVGAETMSPRLQVGAVGFAAAATHCGDADTLGGTARSGVQTRVTGTCTASQKMVGINVDGTAVCLADVDTDTNTTYTAGGGLALSGGNQFSIAAGGVGSANIASNAVTSAHIADGTITHADTDSSSVQRRVSPTGCAAGSAIRVVNADGTVVCQADTDTNTTYSAGAGLSLSGSNQFSIGAGAISSSMIATNAVTGNELASNAVTSVHMADNAIGTAEIANGSITYLDTDVNSVQRRVTGSCTGGISSITATGTVTCASTPTCVSVQSAATTITDSYFHYASATCASGYTLTGGGYSSGTWNANDQNCGFTQSRPSGNTWSVQLQQDSSWQCSGNTFTAYAMCCQF